MAAIRLINLHKRFDAFVAVRDTNLTIDNGEFFVLLGPSGCGKTTTLRMIAGLELPSAGQILLDGSDVTQQRAAKRDIAFVFQLFALYPHMNVWNNLAFPLKAQRESRRDINQKVRDTARLLQIEHLLKQGVSGLAGGDRQRVALGRAIIRRPKAFLMDEPLGTLDAEFRSIMCEELRQLHDRIDATTVYVTHDQIEAMTMADKIAVMHRGEVLQADTPRMVYDRPASKFVASFIGSPAMNFLPVRGPLAPGTEQVRLATGGGETIELAVPALGGPGTGQDATLGIRPEHIQLADSRPGRLGGEVYGVEYLGARRLLTVDTPAGRVKIRTSNTVRVAVGERVGLRLPRERLLLFDNVSEKTISSWPS